MSDSNLNWRAVKWNPLPRANGQEELLIGYYSGDPEIIKRFLSEIGHNCPRLVEVRFKSITDLTIREFEDAREAAQQANQTLENFQKL